MPRTEQFQAQYGVGRTFYFSLDSPSGTSSDRFYTGTDFAAGDVKISKDGGAFANTATTTPGTTLASNGLFSLPLTAGELTATDIAVLLVDQGGPAWRDLHIQIETKLRLGQIDIDASQIGSSASAIKAKASSGGYAFEGIAPSSSTLPLIKGYLESMAVRVGIAQAGGSGTTIKLDSGASSIDDYYNGCLIMLISGTGAGQSRVISDYAGGTLIATVNRAWTAPASGTEFVIVPGADPWNLPLTELANYTSAPTLSGDKLQFLFQRFAFKRTQTAGASALQKLFKADGSTVLSQAAVADDATTQTVSAHAAP